MEAYRERGEHRRAIAVGMAVEGFFDMLEAGLQRHAMTREQRQLRRAAGEAFQCTEAMFRGEFADRVHPGVKGKR